MGNLRVVVVLLAVAACDRGAVPVGGRGEELARLHAFERDMCRCHDAACAKRVSDEMMRWGDEMVKQKVPLPEMSKQEMREAQELGVRMGDCMTRALAGADDGSARDGAGEGL